MNERIKEFAKKCGWLFNGDETGNLQPDPEQFAELIVAECASVLQKEIKTAMAHDGEETQIDLILIDHFGIKE